ncbi:hypothetical protein D3C75_422010 [compost metagenome]
MLVQVPHDDPGLAQIRLQLPNPHIRFLLNRINAGYNREKIPQPELCVHFHATFFIELINVTNDSDLLTLGVTN